MTSVKLCVRVFEDFTKLLFCVFLLTLQRLEFLWHANIYSYFLISNHTLLSVHETFLQYFIVTQNYQKILKKCYIGLPSMFKSSTTYLCVISLKRVEFLYLRTSSTQMSCHPMQTGDCYDSVHTIIRILSSIYYREGSTALFSR